MIEYIASSAAVGRRPSSSRMRSYSSSLSPRSAYGIASSGLACAFLTVSIIPGPPRRCERSEQFRGVGSREDLQDAGEEAEAVGARAAEVLDGVLRVRHDPDHVALLVGD